MLFESRGYRFEAYTLPDTKLVNWLLLAAAMPQDGCLESTNITHVLLAARSLGYYRSRGLDPTTLDWDRFPDFAARCLTPVEATGGWVLFRVRAG
jgi:hypothetical protein